MISNEKINSKSFARDATCETVTKSRRRSSSELSHRSIDWGRDLMCKHMHSGMLLLWIELKPARERGRERELASYTRTALSKHGINHTQQFITNHFNTHGERCNWSRFACVYFFPSHRLNDAIDIVSGGSWTGCWYYLDAIHITKTIDRLTNDCAHSENCTSFIAHYHIDRL